MSAPFRRRGPIADRRDTWLPAPCGRGIHDEPVDREAPKTDASARKLIACEVGLGKSRRAADSASPFGAKPD
jgi:hypothetical protein